MIRETKKQRRKGRSKEGRGREDEIKREKSKV